MRAMGLHRSCVAFALCGIVSVVVCGVCCVALPCAVLCGVLCGGVVLLP